MTFFPLIGQEREVRDMEKAVWVFLCAVKRQKVNYVKICVEDARAKILKVAEKKWYNQLWH